MQKHLISPKGLFLFGSILTVITGFFWIMKTDGAAWHTILFYAWNDQFMDFYNHISYVENPSTVYWSSVHACFPAFAYIFYYALNRMIPAEYTEISTLTRDNPYGGMLFLIYMTVVTLLFVYVADEYMHQKKAEKLLTMVPLFFTVPFLYLFERGNMAYLVIVFLLAFLMLRDSENPVKREMALICLACAAALKIYPALFGMLYLKERRWKETVRAVIYGALIFFVPYLFFGGIEGLLQNIRNLGDVNEMVWQEGCFNSLVHITVMFGYKLGIATETSVYIGKIISYVYFVLLLIAAFCQKSKWRTYALLSGIMIWFPMWSGTYTVTYMSIPLLAFLNESRTEGRWTEYVYAGLFVGIFSLLPFDSELCMGYFGYNLSTVVRYTAMGMLLLMILAEQGAGVVYRLKMKEDTI